MGRNAPPLADTTEFCSVYPFTKSEAVAWSGPEAELREVRRELGELRAVLGDGQRRKLCKGCGVLFVLDDVRRQYCKLGCRHATNQRDWYARSKESRA